jgi:hypothetical protein
MLGDAPELSVAVLEDVPERVGVVVPVPVRVGVATRETVAALVAVGLVEGLASGARLGDGLAVGAGQKHTLSHAGEGASRSHANGVGGALW